MGYDDLARRLKALAVVRHLRVGADGAEQRVGGDLGLLAALNHALDRGAKIAPAAGEEAEGVGVAVNGGMVFDLVVGGDVVGTAPVEKLFLNGFAIGVVADSTMAPVTAEVDRSRWVASGAASGSFFVRAHKLR